MNTDVKPRGTYELLERVGPNLYRHALNGSYYGIKKVAGKKRSHALETKDRRTADRRLADWLAKLDRTDVTAADMTLDALLEKFKAVRKEMAKSTVVSETGMIESMRENFSPGVAIMVARIKPSDVEIWLTRATKGMRNSTINRWRQFTRQLFQMAVDDRVIAESPFVERRNPPKKKQKVNRRCPTSEEFEKIIAEIRQPNWTITKGRRGGQRPKFQHESADFAEFEGRAGLGQAEVAAIRWIDIDENVGEITIRRQKTDQYFKIPLLSGLRPVIERRRKARDEADLKAGVMTPKHDERTLFEIQDVKHALASACERLDLPHFTQRNFRQMRIVELVRGGVNPKTVATWQGHRDGGVLVMKTYTDVAGSGDDEWMKSEVARANAIGIRP